MIKSKGHNLLSLVQWPINKPRYHMLPSLKQKTKGIEANLKSHSMKQNKENTRIYYDVKNIGWSEGKAKMCNCERS